MSTHAGPMRSNVEGCPGRQSGAVVPMVVMILPFHFDLSRMPSVTPGCPGAPPRRPPPRNPPGAVDGASMHTCYVDPLLVISAGRGPISTCYVDRFMEIHNTCYEDLTISYV